MGKQLQGTHVESKLPEPLMNKGSLVGFKEQTPPRKAFEGLPKTYLVLCVYIFKRLHSEARLLGSKLKVFSYELRK